MFENLPSPCYLVDENLLINNLRTLRNITDVAGCKILLAQKAFSMFNTYPLIAEYLDGTCASGLHEARLSHDYMGKENHVFSAAYTDDELDALLPICSHIIFNSFSQWERFCKRMESGINAAGAIGDIPSAATSKIVEDIGTTMHGGTVCKNFGIRINPEISTQGGAAGNTAASGIYDPCAPGSRLGVTAKNFRFDMYDKNFTRANAEESDSSLPKNGYANHSTHFGFTPVLNGLHFHTLCQQNADALEATLAEVEKKFGAIFSKISWINFGGGHHITRPDYDIDRLITIIKKFKQKYPIEVYLEPGEAVALDTGFLVSTVLDIVENSGADYSKIAILDTSAACHMPDVLEMPYRPRIIGAGEAGELPFTYALGGPTCLAGDFIGTYSFEKPLEIGDRVIFEDMAIYSMVKNTTFNGINLPTIAKRTKKGDIEIIRQFGYEDFKNRLS